MILADTDVLIDFLAGSEPGAGAVREALQNGQLVTSSISHFELFCGARTARQREKLERLFQVLPVLGFTDRASARAAEVYRTLEAGGGRIGSADCMIAGLALESGRTLLTRNLRHFERVRGLRVAPMAAN